MDNTVTPAELARRARQRRHVRLSAATAPEFLEDWLPVGIAEQVNGVRVLRNLSFRQVYSPGHASGSISRRQ